MKTKRLLIPFTLAVGLIVAVLCALEGQLAPAEAALPPELSLGLTGNAAAAPDTPAAVLQVCALCTYTTIQAAVDAAGDGDVIQIAAGTYSDVNNYGGLSQLVYISRSLRLQGGWDPTFTFWNPVAFPTILDAVEMGRVVLITGPVTVTVEALNLIGGEAAGLGGGYGGGDVGGGVYAYSATVTISSCNVYGNQGGGLYGFGSRRFVLWASTVTNNTAYGAGGGVGLYEVDDGILTGNQIVGNVAMSSTGSVSGSGGGLYILSSTVVLSYNQILSNTAAVGVTGASVVMGAGGGVYLEASAATLYTNTVLGNVAADINSTASGMGEGGGLRFETAVVSMSYNLVAGNVAGNSQGSGSFQGGGGLYQASGGGTVVATRNVFQGNVALKGSGFMGGGGALCIYGGDVLLEENVVMGNTAGLGSNGEGGGVYIVSVSPALIDNVIADNRASQGGTGTGGGVYMEFAQPTLSANDIRGNTADAGGGVYIHSSPSFTLTNNVIVQNSATDTGDGLWIGGPSAPAAGVLLHNTIAGNDEVGVHVGISTTVGLRNTIIAGHGLGVTVTRYSSVTLEYTLWHSNVSANWAGAGSISSSDDDTGDPAFIGGGNYHITTTSAARDFGTNAGVTVDIDGQFRPQGNGYDVGADELLAINIGGATSGTITYVDDQGLTVTVQVAAGTVTDTATLVFAPVPTITRPLTPGYQFVGHAFDLDLFCEQAAPLYLPLVLRNYSGGSHAADGGASFLGLPVHSDSSGAACAAGPSGQSLCSDSVTFQQPITITLRYSDAGIGGGDENTVRLYYWTGTGWGDAGDSCQSLGVYYHQVNTSTNTVEVAVCHLSRYSMQFR